LTPARPVSTETCKQRKSKQITGRIFNVLHKPTASDCTETLHLEQKRAAEENPSTMLEIKIQGVNFRIHS
jgi:hypothetical protein